MLKIAIQGKNTLVSIFTGVAFETGGVVVGIGMQGLIVGALGGSLSSSACANITVSNSSGVDVDMDILQAQVCLYGYH